MGVGMDTPHTCLGKLTIDTDFETNDLHLARLSDTLLYRREKMRRKNMSTFLPNLVKKKHLTKIHVINDMLQKSRFQISLTTFDFGLLLSVAQDMQFMWFVISIQQIHFGNGTSIQAPCNLTYKKLHAVETKSSLN